MSRDHKLIFKGTDKQRNYVGGGKDGDTDYIIDCKQGDTVFVTEDKKMELLKDHPTWFVEADLEKPKPPEPEAIIEPDPIDIELVPDLPISDVDLDLKTNAELRDIAGTDDRRLSKKKLIKLIESKN